jgi:hypothetical protein
MLLLLLFAQLARDARITHRCPPRIKKEGSNSMHGTGGCTAEPADRALHGRESIRRF